MSNRGEISQVHQRIKSKLEELGHSIEVGKNGSITKIDGHFVFYEVREERSRGHSVWSSKPNGKLRVIVGCIGDTRQFPQRKGMVHDYDGIAAALASRVAQSRARSELAKVRSTNDEAAKEVRKAIGVNEFSTPLAIKASTDPDRPVLVEIELRRAMTAEQAVELHKVLKGTGWIK